MAQATITFQGSTAEGSNGHGALATDAQLVFELAELGTDEARARVLERCVALAPEHVVLAGERDGVRVEITLAAPLADEALATAVGRLHATLAPVAWVPPPPGKTPNFHDLVWAAAAGQVGELVKLRERYERHVGRIVDAYWPHAAKVGAAVVEARRRGRRAVRLEQITGDLAAGEWAEVLQQLDREAARAHNALHGVSQRTAVMWLFSLAAQIYPHFDVRGPVARPQKAELEARKQDLRRVRRYIDEAAKREAPLVYANGMVLGIVPAIAVAAAIALALSWFDVQGIDAGLLFGCVVMGALGAILSVLQRLGGQVAPKLNIEVAREYVRLLGGVRPLVGGVFGLVLYFALESDLLFPSLVGADTSPGHMAAVLTFAFVAGFNERWATGALGSLAGGSGDDDPPSSPAGAAPPTR